MKKNVDSYIFVVDFDNFGYSNFDLMHMKKFTPVMNVITKY